jgi:hypothetical protein
VRGPGGFGRGPPRGPRVSRALTRTDQAGLSHVSRSPIETLRTRPRCPFQACRLASPWIDRVILAPAATSGAIREPQASSGDPRESS